MNNPYVCLVIQLCFTTVTFTSEQQSASNVFFTLPFKQIACVKRVIFVEDANNQKFILKYPRSPNHALNDALGAHVGESIGTNINHVKIFPPHDSSLSSVDRFPDQIKTVHTLVPGNELKKLGNINNKIKIKSGLINKSKLKNLTKHKDLYKIMALDIFLNNWDRHNSNLFYDIENDHFYAIDMDAIFCRQRLLATTACNFIKSLHKEKLSPEAKIALIQLYKNLQHLMVHYPPEKLCELKKNLAAEAHYAYSESDQETFQNLVEHNFHELQRFLRRLKRLLD
ncbi:MAG TPA: hypothetical protein VKR54_02670 [Candidatus Babeliales bacterium]|jgi:hypothetical protein|nr:hypothetical protein [Candidatus Babeliales bacterium]